MRSISCRPALLAVLMLGCACASNHDPPKPAENPKEQKAPPPSAEPSAAAEANDESEPAQPPPQERSLPEGYLAFEHACEVEDVVTIGAVGDVLLHRELQKQAFKAKDRYLNIWSNVLDLLAKPDVTYANLEGPASYGIDRKGNEVDDPGLRFDNKVYSGYARFNYHPSVAKDLVESGIDVVSTANNHAFDRYELGAERTIEALDKAKLRYTGTRRRGSKKPWHTVTEVRGLKIAWIACTLYTNFHKDKAGQVLYCFEDDTVRRLVGKLADSPKVDAVIVTPHWGKEYETEPRPRQVKYAQRWIEAGATAVIGSHPHVLQPWDKIVTDDGREGFVIYSLGNFASHQPELPRRSSMLLYLGLGRRADGTIVPVGARYVPLHVRMEGDREKYFVEAIDRVGGPDDARALVVDMYGPHNVIEPDEPLVVAPHCTPDWPGFGP